MTITVARYFEPSEAHVVRALLESAGLQATVADDQLVTANYPLTGAMGGVRVQVPARQADDVLQRHYLGECRRPRQHEPQLPSAGRARPHPHPHH